MKISRKKLRRLIYEAMDKDMSELRIAGEVDLDIELESEESSEDDDELGFMEPSEADSSYELPQMQMSDDTSCDASVESGLDEPDEPDELLSRGAMYRNRYDGRY